MNSEFENMALAVQALLKAYNKSNEKKVKDAFKKSIHTLLSSDLWGEPNKVSVKAQKFADERGFKKDLESATWNQLGDNCLKDQEKVNANGKRGLILEHVVPRHYLTEWLIACDRNDLEKIKYIMKKTKCAVIHYEEDRVLETKDRPNPANAYFDDAKINLIGIKTKKELIDWIGFETIEEVEKIIYKH